MKYMIEYKVRNQGLTHDQNITNAEALLNAFSKWKPEDGLNIHAFLAKPNNGGYVLVEADDPKVVASFVGKFLFWNDAEVIPVIDINDAVSIAQAAIAWARSSSKG